MSVVVYSTKTCAFCKLVKEYLDEKNIQYEVKYADDDPNLARELLEKSGQLGVPFTVIVDDEGKETSILGFDKSKLDAAFA